MVRHSLVRLSLGGVRSVAFVGLLLLLGLGMAWLLAEDPAPQPIGSSDCPGGGGAGGSTTTLCPPAQTPCDEDAEKEFTRNYWSLGSPLQILTMTVAEKNVPAVTSGPPPMVAYIAPGPATITCTLSATDTDSYVEQSATTTAPKVRNANNECVAPPDDQFPTPAETDWADVVPPVTGTATSQPCVSWSAPAGSFDPAGNCSSTSGNNSSATTTTFTAPTAPGPVTLTATVKNNDSITAGDGGTRNDVDLPRSAVV